MSAETAGDVTPCRGFLHEAFFYSCDDDFLSVAVPFLEAGLAADEPALVSLGRHNKELLYREIPDVERVSFLPDYAQPAFAITKYREMLTRYVAQGARQIRILGEVPHTGTGRVWAPWARYEAAINAVLGNFPLWGLCPYDTRTTPNDVLGDVERTHPQFVSGGKRNPSACFEDPATFLATHEPDYVDPLEQLMPPTIELVDPPPEAARYAIDKASTGTELSVEEVDDLMLAVSESVGNALLHGAPPVELRIWTGADRIVVTVSDRGHGPSHPFAGLLPLQKQRPPGGRGLWIAHQVCAQVTMHREHDGFTIRLIAGRPPGVLGQ